MCEYKCQLHDCFHTVVPYLPAPSTVVVFLYMQVYVADARRLVKGLKKSTVVVKVGWPFLECVYFDVKLW